LLLSHTFPRGLALGLAAAAAFLFGIAQASEPRTLTILYTSEVRSQIRSCNCTKFRYGGYGREATLVSKVRNETKNVILVDGGDFVGDPGSEQEKLKADVATKSMNVIKYTAIVPGENELRFGQRLLDELKAFEGVQVVLANVYDAKTGKPVFANRYWIHKTSDGIRVAIIGLLDPVLMSEPPADQAAVRTADPVEALKELLPQVRKEADLVLVIAHAEPVKAKELAQTAGVDVVLCTHSARKPAMPPRDRNTVDATTENIGSCVVVESSTSQGWSIGRLDLELNGASVKSLASRLYYLDREYEESPEILKIYDEYDGRVRELASREKEELKARVKEVLKQRGYDPSKHNKEDAGAKSGPAEQPAQDSASPKPTAE